MTEELVIEGRFCGPPGIANGGYVAGLLAERLGETAEVTLRKPVPLDKALRLEADIDGHLDLFDGDTLLGEGRATDVQVDVPEAITFAGAEQAAQDTKAFTGLQFARCFVCGTERSAPDSLALRIGAVKDRDAVAAPWVPHRDLATDQLVRVRYVWAALDCAGAYAVHKHTGVRDHLLLGRLAAKVITPISADEQYAVMGWPLDDGDGRRFQAATAIFDARGGVAALARSTWFSVSPPLR